jgi:hypothetical protein
MSTFNETNYRRLRGYLEQLDPAKFDYDRYAYSQQDDGCGCVAVCVAVLTQTAKGDGRTSEKEIFDFLRVTMQEAHYLYGWANQDIDPGSSCAFEHRPIRLGSNGIREAIRRLDVVAARYGVTPAPEPSAPVSSYVPDEGAFLASVRAVAQQPLAVPE